MKKNNTFFQSKTDLILSSHKKPIKSIKDYSSPTKINFTFSNDCNFDNMEEHLRKPRILSIEKRDEISNERLSSDANNKHQTFNEGNASITEDLKLKNNGIILYQETDEDDSNY